MIVTGTFFEGVAKGTFDSFFDGEELDSISRFAWNYPFAVHAHGLEFRLDSNSRHADYLVCLKDSEQTLDTMRRHLKTQRQYAFAKPGVWRFLKHWSEIANHIRNAVPLLWLEYDRPDGEFGGTPGLFLALNSELSTHEKASTLNQSIDILYPSTFASKKQKEVARVLSVLPEGAAVRHLGSMPSRQAAFMRLVIEGLNQTQLLELLLNIGWSGNFAHLSDLLDRIYAEAGIVPTLIDLDFLNGVQSVLGLEFLLIDENTPDDGGLALLSLLQANAWCSVEKCETLRRWLKWTTRESPDMEPGAYWTKLYHIKLVIKQSNNTTLPHVEGKAYWVVAGGPKPETITDLHTAAQRHWRD